MDFWGPVFALLRHFRASVVARKKAVFGQNKAQEQSKGKALKIKIYTAIAVEEELSFSEPNGIDQEKESNTSSKTFSNNGEGRMCNRQAG